MNLTRLRLSDGVLRRSLIVAGLMVGTAAIAAPVVEAGSAKLARTAVMNAIQDLGVAVAPARVERLVWDGHDVDGDGAADFANPTGQGERGIDAYGEGRFGASRDGGVRRHEGVDYMAEAGQTVTAPISGVISKIGYAYADDRKLLFVEISNPALHYAARVFYVDPIVAEGDIVAIGHPIGRTRSLQDKYPGGMTDHVHLEILDRRGRRVDPGEVLSARWTSKPQVMG